MVQETDGEKLALQIFATISSGLSMIGSAFIIYQFRKGPIKNRKEISQKMAYYMR